MRDVWVFRRPAGYENYTTPGGGQGGYIREAEGWTVWVRERHDWGSPMWELGTRMWAPVPHTWTDVLQFASLHAAREAACARVFVLAGAMSAEGLARRCPRGRYIRDGKRADYMLCPWRWRTEPGMASVTAG